MIITESEFNSFFDQVECRKIAMPTTGELVSLPLVAKDGVMMAAFYAADRSKVLDLIPEHFIPPQLNENRTIVAFFAIEYPTIRINNPETDIGVDPYNEILAAVPAILGDASTPPPTLEKIMAGEASDLVYYIHHIAVTTRMAELLGNEFLGYNKFICDIVFEDNETQRKCTVENDGEMIFTLTVSPKPNTFELHRDAPAVASYNNCYNQQKVFKLKYVSQSKIAETMEPCAVLQLGSHPLGKILSGLEIDEKPLLVRYAPIFQLVSDDNNLEIIDLKN